MSHYPLRMESSADRDDLRFRLDWPEGEQAAGFDEDLADFAFDWEERNDAPADIAVLDAAEIAVAGVPQAVEPDDDPAPTDPGGSRPFEFGAESEFDLEPVDVGTRAFDLVAFDNAEELPQPEADYGDEDVLYSVRQALDDNNDALRQLSEAVYELASNVRLLVDEVEAMADRAPEPSSAAGDVTATAIVTLSAEVSGAVEKLADEFNETRLDLQGLMDDMVAAASGTGPDKSIVARLSVDIERVHSELNALKRRIPVRARELDPEEIAERVAALVLARLANAGLAVDDESYIAPSKPVAAPPPTAAPAKRVPRVAPGRRSRPLRAD